MRVLLFVTTHLSPTHKQFLSTCWRQMLSQPFFQDADVIFYLTEAMTRASDLEPLSQFPKAHVTSGVKGLLPWARGQGPATAAMHDPHMFGIWSKYDWVIRLNPDVIVYHPDRLQRYMESPDVDAVLGSCSAPSTDPLDRRVMSDFVVFRPDRINLTTAVHRRSNNEGQMQELNAENDLSYIVRPIVERNRSVWIYEKASGNSCRTKVGTKERREIVHDHNAGACTRPTRWAHLNGSSSPLAGGATYQDLFAGGEEAAAASAAVSAGEDAGANYKRPDKGGSDTTSGFSSIVQLSEALTSDRLRILALNLTHRYKEADPFPHVVIDDIFPAKALEALSRELPEAASEQGCALSNETTQLACYQRKGVEYRKSQIDQERDMGPATRDFFAFLRSPTWVAFLESLTGIAGIVPDPYYSGSGVHIIAPGGMLQVHADFNLRYGRRRRVNTFLYVNPDWPDDFGGHLELWDRNMSECRQRILPKLGRFVAFSSTDFSYHGHPQPIAAPKGRLRRSLALYYYTSDCPKEDCIRQQCHVKHDTLWQRTRGKKCSSETSSHSQVGIGSRL